MPVGMTGRNCVVRDEKGYDERREGDGTEEGSSRNRYKNQTLKQIQASDADARSAATLTALDFHLSVAIPTLVFQSVATRTT